MARLAEFATLVSGTVPRDADFRAMGFVTHDRDEMLVYVDHERWIDRVVDEAKVVAVITNATLSQRVPDDRGLLIADDPRHAFFAIHSFLATRTAFYGDTVATYVDSTARIHERAFVHGSGVRIGARVIVEPNATIHAGVTLEADSIVRAGCIVGADGFQVLASPGVAPWRIPHAGGVVVESGAELRGGTCVDKSLFGGITRVGEQSTLDHHAYIAHDVTVGARCRVGAGAAINGSTSIGEDCWIGPNATLAGGLQVGARAHISLGSVVTLDVPMDGHVTGNFAVDHERFIAWLRTVR